MGHCTLATISNIIPNNCLAIFQSLSPSDFLRNAAMPIPTFGRPKELLSLQLRDSGAPVISATKGRVFFFRRSVGQWFSFSSSPTTSEEELLLASVLGHKEFQSKFVTFAQSPQADPQYFRECLECLKKKVEAHHVIHIRTSPQIH